MQNTGEGDADAPFLWAAIAVEQLNSQTR
ncbi:hypothetical protein GP2143_02784 [marine gamma proteobacterium HTCC2143]|uniref:Uncharacterized protein n=1 Tax=marine gamma proteobacterium HTCC2143 TaxID=247633 RepID=A0YEH8_9GAMM|nr:hypothetical protein GP2143_02784 [marine gamma proteobacterium HTCC2143]